MKLSLCFLIVLVTLSAVICKSEEDSSEKRNTSPDLSKSNQFENKEEFDAYLKRKNVTVPTTSELTFSASDFTGVVGDSSSSYRDSDEADESSFYYDINPRRRNDSKKSEEDHTTISGDVVVEERIYRTPEEKAKAWREKQRSLEEFKERLKGNKPPDPYGGYTKNKVKPPDPYGGYTKDKVKPPDPYGGYTKNKVNPPDPVFGGMEPNPFGLGFGASPFNNFGPNFDRKDGPNPLKDFPDYDDPLRSGSFFDDSSVEKSTPLPTLVTKTSKNITPKEKKKEDSINTLNKGLSVNGLKKDNVGKDRLKEESRDSISFEKSFEKSRTNFRRGSRNQRMRGDEYADYGNQYGRNTWRRTDYGGYDYGDYYDDYPVKDYGWSRGRSRGYGDRYHRRRPNRGWDYYDRPARRYDRGRGRPFEKDRYFKKNDQDNRRKKSTKKSTRNETKSDYFKRGEGEFKSKRDEDEFKSKKDDGKFKFKFEEKNIESKHQENKHYKNNTKVKVRYRENSKEVVRSEKKFKKWSDSDRHFERGRNINKDYGWYGNDYDYGGGYRRFDNRGYGGGQRRFFGKERGRNIPWARRRWGRGRPYYDYYDDREFERNNNVRRGRSRSRFNAEIDRMKGVGGKARDYNKKDRESKNINKIKKHAKVNEEVDDKELFKIVKDMKSLHEARIEKRRKEKEKANALKNKSRSTKSEGNKEKKAEK